MEFDTLADAEQSVGGETGWVILPVGCGEDSIARATIPVNRMERERDD
jgi:hypothetical protein